jgi:hypothetical protein
MYKREIPEEHQPEILEILGRNNSFQFDRVDIERLFFFYYRHIAVIYKGINATKQMQKDLSCRKCVSKVIYYFRTTYL